MEIKLRASKVRRVNTGDIIRCKEFAKGIRFSNAYELDHFFPDFIQKSYLKNGWMIEYDRSRGEALFLILSVEILEDCSPEDVNPDEHYLSRRIHCIRLAEGMVLKRTAERIQFSSGNPMSLIDLDDSAIHIEGQINLPLVWNEPGNTFTKQKPFV